MQSSGAFWVRVGKQRRMSADSYLTIQALGRKIAAEVPFVGMDIEMDEPSLKQAPFVT